MTTETRSNIEKSLQLAEKAAREGNTEQAARHFLAALEQDRSEIRGLLGLGRIALSLGRLKEGERLLDEADRLRPGHPDVVALRGMVHEAQGDYVQAEEAYARAANGNPRSFVAQFNLGRMLAFRKDYASAIRHLTQAVRIEPNQPMAHYSLGVCYKELGKGPEAIRAFAKVLEKSPLFADGYLTLADVLEGLSEWNSAETVLTQALSVLPRNGDVLARAAAHHLRSGDSEKARPCIEALHQGEPCRWTALDELGRLLLARPEEQERREGVALLARAREAAPPGELRPLLSLAFGCWLVGERDRAQEHARRLVEQAPPGHELVAHASQFLEAARSAA
jgi:tetratricopeptide (TPR) repeat protein